MYVNNGDTCWVHNNDIILRPRILRLKLVIHRVEHLLSVIPIESRGKEESYIYGIDELHC